MEGAREMPLVSVILPIRNEARYIGRCLDAVSGQEYDPARLEILVVDGMSEDGTRERVRDCLERASTRGSRTQLIDNPERIVPTALNRGLRAAQGDVVIRVDGHCVIAPDYVRRCVEDLDTVEADCVGGAIQTVGETTGARAIALAQSSPFGVGGARFRYSTEPGYVDTLAFGAYRRAVFERIGLFDEELVRNQDDEFNLRLTRSGGKIWLDPQIRSTYYSRASIRALWKQYFEYGLWKVRVIQKHGRPAAWRHLMPMLLVAALAGSVGLSALTWNPIWMALVVGPYVLACVAAGVYVAARKGWQYLVYLPLAFMTMHVGYGVGFWAGLVRFGMGRAPAGEPQTGSAR